MRKTILAIAAVSMMTATTLAADAPAPKNDYANESNWLCLAGRADDACSADQDATIVAANGAMTPEKFKPAKNAPIDCFYVYPTVSRDRSVNSDMNPGVEELSVITQQFARFGSVCKTYAPLYRQFTVTALFARMTGRAMAPPADPQMAYHDVVDAWNYYLAHYNKGRGVVLIGHSQGSGMLTRLIKDEIDGKPIQKQIVLAILGGTRLKVPAGKDVGGDFQHMPLCHSATTPGCVIAFASFRASQPPEATTFFGKVDEPGMEAACVNPAALGGGSGKVHAYLAFFEARNPDGSLKPKAWAGDKTSPTPFVSVPGLLTAECARNQYATYLSVTVHGDPKDPRTDDIPGDLVIAGMVQKDWGLHLADMNLFMGNMIDDVRSAGAAWLTMKR